MSSWINVIIIINIINQYKLHWISASWYWINENLYWFNAILKDWMQFEVFSVWERISRLSEVQIYQILSIILTQNVLFFIRTLRMNCVIKAYH